MSTKILRQRSEGQKLHDWWKVKQTEDAVSTWKSKHREVVIPTDEPDVTI